MKYLKTYEYYRKNKSYPFLINRGYNRGQKLLITFDEIIDFAKTSEELEHYIQVNKFNI